MNTNRGGQGSSSRAGQNAPHKGTSEAGGSRGRGQSPTVQRPAATGGSTLNRDALRKSLAQKKQVDGASIAATASKGQAVATAAKGQTAATAAKDQAAATAGKGKSPVEKSSSGKGKEKRRLEDASLLPRPPKVRVTDDPKDGFGAAGSANAPVGEIPLGGIYVPA